MKSLTFFVSHLMDTNKLGDTVARLKRPPTHFQSFCCNYLTTSTPVPINYDSNIGTAAALPFNDAY